MNTIQKITKINKILKKLWESEDLGGSVESVSWSPDGSKIAVGCDCGRVFVFDSNGNKMWESKDLGGKVYGVSWSRDGSRIATGVSWRDNSINYHGRVFVFDSNGDKLWESEDLGDLVSSVSWSPDGSKLAVGCNCGRVFVFDSNGDKLWEKYLGRWVLSVSWSPDGSKIAVGTGCCVRGRVFVFDSNGDKLWESEDLGDEVSSVSWSPDGDKIAVGVGEFLAWGRVFVFDSNGDKLWESEDLGDIVRSVSWSPDGDKIAVVIDDAPSFIFNKKGEKLLKYAGKSVSWSPDGDKIAVCDVLYVYIFNINSDKLWESGDTSCLHVSWSPDGDKIAVGSLGWVLVYSFGRVCGLVYDVLAGRFSAFRLYKQGGSGVCRLVAGVVLGRFDGISDEYLGFVRGYDWYGLARKLAEKFDESGFGSFEYGLAELLVFGSLEVIEEVASYFSEALDGKGVELFYGWLESVYRERLKGLPPIEAGARLRELLGRVKRLIGRGGEGVWSCLEGLPVDYADGLDYYLEDCLNDKVRVGVEGSGEGARICNRSRYPLTVITGGIPRLLEPGDCLSGLSGGSVVVEAPWGKRYSLRLPMYGLARGSGRASVVGGSGLGGLEPGVGVFTEFPIIVSGFVEGPSCRDGRVLGGGVFRFLRFEGWEPRGECRVCRLGCGGWGCAYHCVSGGESVVIKVPLGFEALLEGDVAEMPSVSQRVMRKVSAMVEAVGSLRHPHLVRLLGYSPVAPVLVYEFADLGSLEYQVGRGWEAGLVDVLGLLLGLADAVRYIHSRGLVHGDIKASNVFVVSPGVVKLGDFSGMRRLLAKTSSRSSLHYTVGWRAPEQVDLYNLGRRSRELGYENRVDVFQLANLALYLLTGETVDGEELILEGEELLGERLGDVGPDGLRLLLTSMLAVEPWRRPSSDEVVRRLAGLYASAGRRG